MKIETFKDAITSVYKNNPCRIQPNALWKTLNQINNYNSDFTLENNKVKSLKIWNNDMLYTYWDRDKKEIDVDNNQLSKFKMVLAHETQMNDDLRDIYPIIKSYFRLLHNYNEILEVDMPEGYYLRNVAIKEESEMVSNLISDCYDNIKPNLEEVLKWTRHPVFEKDLWIWIIDKRTEKPVGLGIAELDSDINEGSLEWIQVLPDYQGKKLGKVLVIELLNRLKPYVDFITVSGEVDNKTNPERLYRSCGFHGDDVWYVLKK